MNIAVTSILAFKETVSEREIQANRLLGMYLSIGTMSDREAAYRLGWYPSQVSARRNDLMKQDRVVELGKKKDPDTGKLVNQYGVIKNSLFD